MKKLTELLKGFGHWLKLIAIGMVPFLLSTFLIGIICRLVRIVFLAGFNLI